MTLEAAGRRYVVTGRESIRCPACSETSLYDGRPFDNRGCKTPSGGDKLPGVMPDPTATRILDLSDRDLDVARLTNGMGGEAAHAATLRNALI